MIVKCLKCQDSMRVDESRIPEGQKVKIRCPICGETQPYTKQFADTAPVDQQEVRLEGPTSPQIAATADRTVENKPEKGPEELTIPADAFQDFRFPAERGAAASRKDATKPASRKGIPGWLFALVSLGIVAMFALIVNIVLPGPAGKKPDSGLPQWEESSDQKAPASPQKR